MSGPAYGSFGWKVSVVRETAKAFLFLVHVSEDGFGHVHGPEVWVPKSACHWVRKDFVVVARWVAGKASTSARGVDGVPFRHMTPMTLANGDITWQAREFLAALELEP